MQSWQVVLVVLGSVLVGILVPVLLQLRATLAEMERRLKTTGRRVDQTLDHVSGAAERLHRLMGALDGGEKQMASLFASVGQLAQTLERARSTINVASAVGAALGPAVVAMVRSFGEQDDVQVVNDEKSPRTGGNGRVRDGANPPSQEETDYG